MISTSVRVGNAACVKKSVVAGMNPQLNGFRGVQKFGVLSPTVFSSRFSPDPAIDQGRSRRKNLRTNHRPTRGSE